jgi:hypothetical protein
MASEHGNESFHYTQDVFLLQQLKLIKLSFERGKQQFPDFHELALCAPFRRERETVKLHFMVQNFVF